MMKPLNNRSPERSSSSSSPQIARTIFGGIFSVFCIYVGLWCGQTGHTDSTIKNELELLGEMEAIHALTEKSVNSFLNIDDRKLVCPSWDEIFSRRFEQTCGNWRTRIEEWGKLVRLHDLQPAMYSCSSEHELSCHGIGDRLSGIHSVLEYAIKYNRPLRIKWKDLPQVFEPTCLLPETWMPQATDQFAESCKMPKISALISHCDTFKRRCNKPRHGVEMQSYIRACASAASCTPMLAKLTSFENDDKNENIDENEIQDEEKYEMQNAENNEIGENLIEENKLSKQSARRTLGSSQDVDKDDDDDDEASDPDRLTQHELEHFRGTGYDRKKMPVALRSGTAAHVFGCPMRSLFQLTNNFFKLQVAWIHNQKSAVRSVAEVQQLIQKYFTISIHFRMGDSSFKTDGINVKRRWGELVPAFDCATSVERYVIDNNINKGKPVRWIFSSDSTHLRELVLEKYGDKIMMLDERPLHVGHSSATALTMAEWYLLSLGDRLVLNRSGHTVSFFEGRLSGYAKTMWAYQLKHLYYDAGHCQLRSMNFDGSWKPDVRVCLDLTRHLKYWDLPQPHRAYGNWGGLTRGVVEDKTTVDAYSDDVLFGETTV